MLSYIQNTQSTKEPSMELDGSSLEPLDGLLPNNISNTSVQLAAYGTNMWQNYTLGVPTAPARPWPLVRLPMEMVIPLSTAYVIVFVLAIVNNCLVIAVIYRNPQLRTVTNIFIANMAVADVLVTILVLPLTLLQSVFTEWLYGPFMCKAAAYLQGVSVASSVNTLAAIAVERYFAIFYPQTARLTPRSAVIVIAFIWAVPMCLMIPWAVAFQQKPHIVRYQGWIYHFEACVQTWSVWQRKAFTLGVIFFICYLVPLAFISVFYMLIGMRVWKRQVRGMRGTRAERNIHRSKIKIIKMLVVVFIMFALSWLPLYCLQISLLFMPQLSKHHVRVLRRYIIPIAQWLGSANSCMNPFIYCYFSQPFRRSIVAVVRSKTCCGKITT